MFDPTSTFPVFVTARATLCLVAKAGLRTETSVMEESRGHRLPALRAKHHSATVALRHLGAAKGAMVGGPRDEIPLSQDRVAFVSTVTALLSRLSFLSLLPILPVSFHFLHIHSMPFYHGVFGLPESPPRRGTTSAFRGS